eukprot:272854-Chlamydomonas_euryale.AAC.3
MLSCSGECAGGGRCGGAACCAPCCPASASDASASLLTARHNSLCHAGPHACCGKPPGWAHTAAANRRVIGRVPARAPLAGTPRRLPPESSAAAWPPTRGTPAAIRTAA